MAEEFFEMTVNERLFAAGLLEQYESAQAQGDDKRIDQILQQVNLQQDSDGKNWTKKGIEG